VHPHAEEFDFVQRGVEVRFEVGKLFVSPLTPLDEFPDLLADELPGVRIRCFVKKAEILRQLLR